MKKERIPLVVFVDNIRSLHNVGAFFRTCDAFLVEKLILCGVTGCPPSKEIEKTALGACEVVPWEYFENTVTAVKEYKENGYKIFAMEQTKESEEMTNVVFPTKLGIVVGNEVEGVGHEVLENCEKHFEVPMYGKAKSLNVSVALGMAIYEINRQWND